MTTTKEEPKALVDLATAHVTQHSKEGVKSDWKLEKNITNEELERFPSHISDELMFKILDFARKYELIALNAGIQYGKKVTVKVYDKQRIELERRLDLATKENIRIATSLEEHIKRETDGIN